MFASLVTPAFSSLWNYLPAFFAVNVRSGDETVLLVVFIFWMLLVLGIGVWTSRFAKSTESFFLGDRKMGAWLTAVSSTASSESGWLLLGCVGEAYMWGAQAVWIAIGCLLGYTFNWFFFAEKLREATKKMNSITVPDYLEERVKDKSHIIRITAVIIIILLMFTYVAAQMNAAGKSLNAIFGMDYRLGVLIGGIVTVLYTVMGGYRAVTWTDLVQGLLMVLALVVMPIVTIFHLGGPVAAAKKLAASPGGAVAIFEVKGTKTYGERIEGEPEFFCPDDHKFYTKDKLGDKNYSFQIDRKEDEKTGKEDFYVNIPSNSTVQLYQKNKESKKYEPVSKTGVGGTFKLSVDEYISLDNNLKIEYVRTFVNTGGKNLLKAFGGRTGLGLVGFVLGMLGIGLGYPGTPHVVTRYMSAKSDKEIRQGRVIAITWGVLSMYGAIILGMAARVLLPHTIDPESSMLIAGKMLLHPVFAGIVLAAVISAILSTADSQLLVAASAVTRDIYEKVLSKKDVPEEKMVMISRVTVFVLGLLAVLLALTKSRIVFWFVLFSWGGLGASFGPILILSLYWKKLTKWGMFWGMVTGFSVNMAWKLVLKDIVGKLTGLVIYELVPAFILAFVVAVVVSLVTNDDKKKKTG